MSAWNTCVGLAFVMGGVADVIAAGHDDHRVVDNETYEELEGEIANDRDGEHPEPDESTPLIQYPAQSSSNRQPGKDNQAETLAETWLWIPQFIVSVPLPLILFAQVTMLLLDAMPQTLADGSPVVTGQFHSCVIISSTKKDTKCFSLQYMH